MSDVAVRSLAERLVTIAADCFDRRAAERLRELAGELLDSNPLRQPEQRDGAAERP
jgi:hypothetical protein